MAIQVLCYALGADSKSADVKSADGGTESSFPLISGGEERGVLRGERMLRRVDRPTAHVYLPASERERTGALVAICPGGGAYLPVFSSVQMRVYWRSTSGGMMAKVNSLASTSGVG